MKVIFPTWKECQTPGYVGLLCHHFDNKHYWTCWFLQCCFFFSKKEIGMYKNTWPLRNSCRILCSPQFWVHRKGICSPPHLHQPTPSNKWQSTLAPLFYLLILAFWGDVMKDRKDPFSPSYVRLKNFSCYCSFLVYQQKLWNLILVVKRRQAQLWNSNGGCQSNI